MDQPLDAWKAQLGSLDVTARVEAAQHLGKLPEVSTEAETLDRTGVLTRCATQDPESWVRSTCMDGLASLADPTQSPAVRDAAFAVTSLLSTEKDAQVLESAASLLAKYPEKQSLEPLQKLIEGPSLKGAVAAIHAMGALQGSDMAYYGLVYLLGATASRTGSARRRSRRSATSRTRAGWISASKYRSPVTTRTFARAPSNSWRSSERTTAPLRIRL